jgi:hypothetical protein
MVIKRHILDFKAFHKDAKTKEDPEKINIKNDNLKEEETSESQKITPEEAKKILDAEGISPEQYASGPGLHEEPNDKDILSGYAYFIDPETKKLKKEFQD